MPSINAYLGIGERRMKRIITYVSILIFSFLHISVKAMDKSFLQEISQYILANDTSSIIKAMQARHLGINDYLDAEQTETALSLAIKLKQKDVVAYLLHHQADPNIKSKSEAPLILAIQNDEPEIVKLLLDNKAEPDVSDDKGNTPVVLCIKGNQLSSLLYLVKAGANLLAKDKSGKIPLDYIRSATDSKLAAYVRHFTRMQENALNWPPYTDGPIVEWKDSTNFEVKHYYTRNHRLCEKSALIQVNHLPYVLQSPLLSHPIEIQRTYARPAHSLEMPDRLMAIGDLHGDLESLVRLLIGNQVIDSSLTWIWGKGELVFIGDIFDRGNEVTELLWFIQNLENEAQNHGGRVHFILGNHETMALIGDHRYLEQKYRNICEYFSMDYWQFYTLDTELGRYIRSKPVIIKIGNVLFVHGGIGPDLLHKRLSISEINNIIYNIFTTERHKLNELELFMLMDDGPLWYRDLLEEYGYFSTLPESHIDSVLSFYKVSHIVIGHSEVPQINSRHNGKVIAINVPFYYGKYIPQALLIDSNRFFIVDANGKKTPLFE